MVYQMDVKSAFLYGTIEEEDYVCQPLGFKDPDHPDKVYKVVKALYGLHQTPRAWYETLANYLLENGSKSTPIDTKRPLLKDLDGEDVDVHTYRSMIGLLMYLTSSRPDIMFAVNDVTRLQALVDKKKVVVTEATIREALRLDDAEGVVYLPNEEIFTKLARMGYEKPFTKLTFYKAFFSSQWNLVRNVDSTTKFYMYPCFLQLIIRKQVGKGFFGVETPLFEGMLVELEVNEEGDGDEHVKEVNNSDAAKGDDSAVHGEVPIVAEEQFIPSPIPPNPPLQPPQDIPSTSQDDTVVLEDDKEEDREVTDAVKDVEEAKKLLLLVAAAPSRRRKGVVIRDPEEVSTTSIIIPAETKSKDKGKGILVEDPKPIKKKQQIELDEQYAKDLHAELNKDSDWDEATNHVKRKAKKDLAVKKYQAMKRKPQTEAQARKNMMMYLKNVTGFKMDYFKGMSYDYIRLIFEAKFNSNVAFLLKIKEQIEEDKNRALQILNETSAERASKRRKLDEDVEDLKRHLQIVPNKDDDVYTEATPLGRKVPVVDYQTQRNEHGPTKVKGWKLQESCGLQIIAFTSTQLILLVEKKYSLTRFTLDQMLNAVRLEVEEESEVSLEILSFGVDATMDLKKNMLSV
nr:putative ribonuclease H-like domain-containing protein [Tanacetum cinerariifolium]